MRDERGAFYLERVENQTPETLWAEFRAVANGEIFGSRPYGTARIKEAEIQSIERRQLMSLTNRDQMAKSIILWGVEESSMGVGSWNDEIICTLRKNGSLSLRPRKRGDDGTVSMAGVKRIRSPKIFLQALISMADSCFYYDINPKEILDEICPRLDQLDPKFSQEIRAYISSSDVKIPESKPSQR